jgi:FkbM family methyltransferase
LGRLIAYLLGDPPAAQGSIGELCLWLRPADRTASEAFWSGRYEDGLTNFLLALLEPGMTVVDAGANVGMIGLRLADQIRRLGSGHVFLVEPVPANACLLTASVQSNQLEDFCTVCEVGLADSAGSATLLVESRGARSGNAGVWALAKRRRGLTPTAIDAGLWSLAGRRRSLTPTAITLRTLDDLVRDAGEPTIDLLKLDVEGAELSLLHGARRSIERSRPLIFGEFHPDLMSLHRSTFVDVMDFLAPIGYRAFAISSRRHLVEVPAEPGRSEVLLATSDRLERMTANRARDWHITDRDDGAVIPASHTAVAPHRAA